MMRKILLIFLLLFIINPIIKAQNKDSIYQVIDDFDYNYFHKNLEYLSSDELKGRNTGTEEYQKAAQYVATEFKNMGLVPYGDSGTFFQTVPLIQRSIIKSTINFKSNLNNETVVANYGDDITLIPNSKYPKIDEHQKLVFVGFGNIIPDQNINDYEGVDVKGKTVIAVLGAPKTLKGNNAFDPFSKVKNATEQGASGIIIFFPKGLFQNMIFKQIHGFTGQPIVSLADTSLSTDMFEFDLKIGAFSKKDFVKDIFKQNDLNLGKSLRKIKRGEIVSRELNSKIHCSYEIKVENVNCKNVVALYPGTDSSLSKEYVTIGAHLDHVGVGEPVKGDSIYNGMWDNATGSAALLSIAKTYKEKSISSKRSMIFIGYTGEEKGLLGSTYFANYNPVNDGKIVANINIDMLGGLFPTKDIIALGYSHSNLSEAVDFSAKELGLIVDDNKKEEGEYLFRSDQASFLQKGIPALNVANGYIAYDSKINAEKEIGKWMKKHYHSPSDDMQQEYSQEAFLLALKYNFLSVYYITNFMGEIKWNEESWIYKRYVLKEE